MNDADFARVFAPLQMQEEEKRKVFIEKEILADPEMRSLTRVIGINFTKRRYVKSKVLFSEGDRPEKLYFVYEGHILLWTDSLDIKDRDKKKLMQYQDNKEDKCLIKDFTPKRTQKYDIMLSGAGKMVGEEEIFSGQRRRYNAVVDSECLVYEIECERMLNVCYGNHFVRNILQQKISDKIKLVNTILDYKRLLESVTDNLVGETEHSPTQKKRPQMTQLFTTQKDPQLDLIETDRQMFNLSPLASKYAVNYLADRISRTKIKPTYVNPLMKHWLQPSILDARLIIEALISVKKKPKAEWSPLLRKLKEAEAKLRLMLQKEAQIYEPENKEGTDSDAQWTQIDVNTSTNDNQRDPVNSRDPLPTDRESFLSGSRQMRHFQLRNQSNSPERAPLYVTQQEYDESQLTGGDNPKSSSGILTNVPDHDSMMQDVSSMEAGRFIRHLKQQSVRITNWGDDLSNSSRKKIINPTMVRCLKQMELRKAQELSKQTESITTTTQKKKREAVNLDPAGNFRIEGSLYMQPLVHKVSISTKTGDLPMWMRRTNSLHGLMEVNHDSTASLAPQSPVLANKQARYHTKYNSLVGDLQSDRDGRPHLRSLEITSPSKDGVPVVGNIFQTKLAEGTVGGTSTAKMFPRLVHKSHHSLGIHSDLWMSRTERPRLENLSDDRVFAAQGVSSGVRFPNSKQTAGDVCKDPGQTLSTVRIGFSGASSHKADTKISFRPNLQQSPAGECLTTATSKHVRIHFRDSQIQEESQQVVSKKQERLFECM